VVVIAFLVQEQVVQVVVVLAQMELEIRELLAEQTQAAAVVVVQVVQALVVMVGQV
jgi:hypothetical protein